MQRTIIYVIEIAESIYIMCERDTDLLLEYIKTDTEK